MDGRRDRQSSRCRSASAGGHRDGRGDRVRRRDHSRYAEARTSPRKWHRWCAFSCPTGTS